MRIGNVTRKTPIIFGFFILTGLVQAQEPSAWWTYDTVTDRTITDPVNGSVDHLVGYYQLQPGVQGNSLKLDGYTSRVIRESADIPDIRGGLTIESWVALQTFPWNRSAIVNQGLDPSGTIPGLADREHRFFLGIDAFGHLCFRMMLDDTIRECISGEPLPLLEWNHVAGTYDENEGLKVYLNGALAGELKVKGKMAAGPGTDLLVGMNTRKLGAVGSERKASADLPSKMVIHGLLDETRLYDQPLSGDQLMQHYLDEQPAENQPLKFEQMPSGPSQLPAVFDAVYTRLEYTDEWEAPWKVSSVPDILVHFDQSPVRFIFWRGTSYGGVWVTENGRWMGDQSLERAGGGKSPMGCSEHMSDKLVRYSNVRIIEKNDARIVIHWRYAISDILYDIFGITDEDPRGEWADEFYTIYPDGVVVRHQVLYTHYLSHEWQETIVINQPGTSPDDNIELEALTLLNMDGEQETYSWAEGGPASFPAPEEPNIQVVNLKSVYKPFIIFEPRPRIRPFNPATIRPEVAHFPWWNHWPVGQIPNDGRRAFSHDRPSHSSLAQSIEDSDVIHDRGDGSYEVVTLTGMTDQPAESLVALARSWNDPAAVTRCSEGFSGGKYSRKERAYVFSAAANELTGELAFRIDASEKSPLVNPAFRIQNWGAEEVLLEVDGKKMERGTHYRTGTINTLEGQDLVVWLQMHREDPVRIRLSRK